MLSREMVLWTLTEIYLYCSITYSNNCNNSRSLKSSFEKNALHTGRFSFVIHTMDSTLSKHTSLLLARSSDRGYFCPSLYHSGGCNWCLVHPAPYNSHVSLRQIAIRPIACISFMTELVQSREDALTRASFCSFILTASLYAWFSLAPNRPGPLPFLFRSSSTFLLSSAGTL